MLCTRPHLRHSKAVGGRQTGLPEALHELHAHIEILEMPSPPLAVLLSQLQTAANLLFYTSLQVHVLSLTALPFVQQQLPPIAHATRPSLIRVISHQSHAAHIPAYSFIQPGKRTTSATDMQGQGRCGGPMEALG